MLKNVESSKGFLIDGYPREVPQAKKFEEMVDDRFHLEKNELETLFDRFYSVFLLDCSVQSGALC